MGGTEALTGTTDENEFRPSSYELALLEVMLDPRNRLGSVVETCALVPCDRKVYYRAMKKPEFVKLYLAESIALTHRAVAPVLNSVIREATRGSYQHAKIVLGMADVYHERKELTGKDGAELNALDKLTDAQLDARIEQLMAKGAGHDA